MEIGWTARSRHRGGRAGWCARRFAAFQDQEQPLFELTAVMVRRSLQSLIVAPRRGLVPSHRLGDFRRLAPLRRLGGKEIACQCTDEPLAAVAAFDLPPTRLTLFGDEPGDFVEALIGFTGFVYPEHPNKPPPCGAAAILELGEPSGDGAQPLNRDQRTRPIGALSDADPNYSI
jgi:hypothetical protein